MIKKPIQIVEEAPKNYIDPRFKHELHPSLKAAQERLKENKITPF